MIAALSSFATDICQGFCTSQNTGLPKVAAGHDQITIILQYVFATIGVIALVFIILSGIRLAASIGSDPQAFAKARNSLIFAAVGLAVAISAEAIVTFVLGRL